MSLKRTDGIQAKCDIMCELNNHGLVYPKVGELKRSDFASALGMGERTFIRHVNELSELEFLYIESGNRHQPNAYGLYPDSMSRFLYWLVVDCEAQLAIDRCGDMMLITVHDVGEWMSNFSMEQTKK